MVIWGIDLMPIVNDLIHWAVLALIPIIVGAAFKLYRKYAPLADDWFKAHIGVEQRELLNTLARVAVLAVEQICKRDDVKAEGAAKLQAACNYVDGSLKAHGINGITMEMIIPVVEAAVKSELNTPAAPVAPAAETAQPAAPSRITTKLPE